MLKLHKIGSVKLCEPAKLDFWGLTFSWCLQYDWVTANDNDEITTGHQAGKENDMTEITLNLSGREVLQVLDGLLQMGYDYGQRAEKEELRVIEYQMDENEIGEQMASARVKTARDKEAAAYSAYNKIKAEAMRIGLIS